MRGLQEAGAGGQTCNRFDGSDYKASKFASFRCHPLLEFPLRESDQLLPHAKDEVLWSVLPLSAEVISSKLAACTAQGLHLRPTATVSAAS